jgi:hypothetical protein
MKGNEKDRIVGGGEGVLLVEKYRKQPNSVESDIL